MSERRVSLLIRPDGRWSVEVIGSKGTFHGVRKTLAMARATAHCYAALLDAPREVI